MQNIKTFQKMADKLRISPAAPYSDRASRAHALYREIKKLICGGYKTFGQTYLIE